MWSKAARTFTVVTDSGKEFDAKLIGTDPRTDLAVLKVDPAGSKFTYVDFADDAKVRVGDWVVAVGNPFGLGGTVTAGIVSARGRDIGAGPYDDFLQIDAAVNRGNSGGPAFNLSGEVVGINTAIFSPSGGSVGIAFAIPASTAREVVQDLIKDGAVQRGWLGVEIQPVTPEIANSLGLTDDKGALVSNAQADGPAKKAGVVAGDVITAVDGKDVASPKELARIIGGIAPGKSVDVTLWRGGKSEVVKVDLGELPGAEKQAALGDDSDKAPEQTDQLADLGLTVTSSDDGKGIVVTAVEPGSDAAERGIEAGDVITSVNTTAISAPQRHRQGDGRCGQGRAQGGPGAGYARRRQPVRDASGRQGLSTRADDVLQSSSALTLCQSRILPKIAGAFSGSCFDRLRRGGLIPRGARAGITRTATSSQSSVDGPAAAGFHRLLPKLHSSRIELPLRRPFSRIEVT